MLIERLPGHHLYRIWDNLSLNDKKAVLSDIAGVLAQLSKLKFSQIGCVNSYNEIGPLLFCIGSGSEGKTPYAHGPFGSTISYLRSFLDAQSDESEVFSEVKKVIESYILTHDDSPDLVAPYHADFDAQNLLFRLGRYVMRRGT